MLHRPAKTALVPLLVVLAATSGCLDTQAVVCGKYICPVGSLCNPYTKKCVDPTESERVCQGELEYTPCEFEGQFPGVQYYCRAGLCSYAYCGDGELDRGLDEVCDDGGESSACDIDCTLPRCGDGVVNAAAGEVCDCGDGAEGGVADGCAAANGQPGSACGASCGLVCQDGWVLVLAGDFIRGCDEGDHDGKCQFDERPAHTATLSQDLCIHQSEVTVAQYRACVEASECTVPGTEDLCMWTPQAGAFEDRPVNCVTWHQARAFCQWLGGDLPTEAEWEKAARGEDGRRYPWGDEEPGNNCDQAINSYCPGGLYPDNEPWPVGSTDPAGNSPYEAWDMAGNLAEMVLDRYQLDAYHALCTDGCTDPVVLGDGPVVIRGGSQASGEEFLRTTARSQVNPDAGQIETGFRCRWPGRPELAER